MLGSLPTARLAAWLAALALAGCVYAHPSIEEPAPLAGGQALRATLGPSEAHLLTVLTAPGVERAALALADGDDAARFARSGREAAARYLVLARLSREEGLRAVALVEVLPDGLWVAHPTGAGPARAVVVLPFSPDPPSHAAAFAEERLGRAWLSEQLRQRTASAAEARPGAARGQPQ